MTGTHSRATTSLTFAGPHLGSPTRKTTTLAVRLPDVSSSGYGVVPGWASLGSYVQESRAERLVRVLNKNAVAQLSHCLSDASISQSTAKACAASSQPIIARKNFQNPYPYDDAEREWRVRNPEAPPNGFFIERKI